MARVFLQAEWRKLILANYQIDPAALQPYLPYQTEIDLWQGRCYISLVGFLFKNTRVLGLKIPGHVNFAEVNLRFYVRYNDAGEWKRGVVFIKEIVPRAAITLVANTLYGEHYATHAMRHQWQNQPATQTVRYEWKVNQRWNRIAVTAERTSRPLVADSEAAFITEHYWGYTRLNARRTGAYQVEHPSWETYPVLDYQIEGAWETLYGLAFAEAMREKPLSVFLAEGSGVLVRQGKKIRAR